MSGETMLAKMVKAMNEELARQTEAGGYYSGPDNEEPNYLDGHYDQTLVAKAALLAIREPSDDVIDTMDDWAEHYPPESVWRAAIDEILNESPSPSVTHQTGDKP